PRDYGMGTTCTAAYIHNGQLSLAHVGDSRCYLIRGGVMQQITEDHLFVTEQLRRGVITPEQAATANHNILSRALGTDERVPVDLEERNLAEGDVLLLCTDGLNKEVTDAEILQVVEQTPDPAELVQRLVDLANAAQGRDNITVAVARVE
ncbi:MAG TPA: SpoIIE family protein phosphatase, partial [Terriglobia bacterium]|nr:SpoIIE family protein phosphatase [Terriglobia bacterium]